MDNTPEQILENLTPPDTSATTNRIEKALKKKQERRTLKGWKLDVSKIHLTAKTFQSIKRQAKELNYSPEVFITRTLNSI